MVEQAIIAAKVISYGVKGLRLLERLDKTQAFIARRDQQDLEWFAEVVNAIRSLEERMSTLEQEALAARLDDHEAIGVLANYANHAHDEPIDKRRRMLIHAAAGLANVHISVAAHARVQRALHELDPDDVVALYTVWLVPTRQPRAELKVSHVDALRFKLWNESGADSLLTTGCVRTYPGTAQAGGTEELLRVTRLGLTVLRVLRSYITARAPDVTKVPGHEVTAQFRSYEEARKLIDALPGLYDTLLSSRGAGFGQGFEATQFSGCNVAGGAPANGKARLIVWLSPERARELQQLAPAERVEMQQPVATVFVEDIEQHPDEQGRVRAYIGGPHDVLRFTAYELDALWG